MARARYHAAGSGQTPCQAGPRGPSHPDAAYGGKLKAELHKAEFKPTLTLALGDGTNVRRRAAL